MVRVGRWHGKVGDGDMHDHCLVLLSYMERNRLEKNTIRGLAVKLGIPRSSLHDILQDAAENKLHSTLYLVAATYGFDFKVYLRPASNNKRILIDVVKSHKEYEPLQ